MKILNLRKGVEKSTERVDTMLEAYGIKSSGGSALYKHYVQLVDPDGYTMALEAFTDSETTFDTTSLTAYLENSYKNKYIPSLVGYTDEGISAGPVTSVKYVPNGTLKGLAYNAMDNFYEVEFTISDLTITDTVKKLL